MTSATTIRPGTVFPNPPLREAAFEVRFNPLLKVARDIPTFQENLVDSYPVLGTQPLAIDDEMVSTYTFSTEDRASTVRASVRSCGYSVLRYSGYEEFKREALRTLDVFVEVFGVRNYRRVGLRYINAIDLRRQDGRLNFEDLVVPVVSPERYPPSEIQQQTVVLVLRKRAGTMAIRSGIVIPSGESAATKAAYLLDLDFYTNDAGRIETVSEHLDEFHSEIEREFLAHITDAMVERMMEVRANK